MYWNLWSYFLSVFVEVVEKQIISFLRMKDDIFDKVYLLCLIDLILKFLVYFLFSDILILF